MRTIIAILVLSTSHLLANNTKLAATVDEGFVGMEHDFETALPQGVAYSGTYTIEKRFGGHVDDPAKPKKLDIYPFAQPKRAEFGIEYIRFDQRALLRLQPSRNIDELFAGTSFASQTAIFGDASSILIINDQTKSLRPVLDRGHTAKDVFIHPELFLANLQQLHQHYLSRPWDDKKPSQFGLIVKLEVPPAVIPPQLADRAGAQTVVARVTYQKPNGDPAWQTYYFAPTAENFRPTLYFECFDDQIVRELHLDWTHFSGDGGTTVCLPTSLDMKYFRKQNNGDLVLDQRFTFALDVKSVMLGLHVPQARLARPAVNQDQLIQTSSLGMANDALDARIALGATPNEASKSWNWSWLSSFCLGLLGLTLLFKVKSAAP